MFRRHEATIGAALTLPMYSFMHALLREVCVSCIEWESYGTVSPIHSFYTTEAYATVVHNLVRQPSAYQRHLVTGYVPKIICGLEEYLGAY